MRVHCRRVRRMYHCGTVGRVGAHENHHEPRTNWTVHHASAAFQPWQHESRRVTRPMLGFGDGEKMRRSKIRVEGVHRKTCRF